MRKRRIQYIFHDHQNNLSSRWVLHILHPPIHDHTYIRHGCRSRCSCSCWGTRRFHIPCHGNLDGSHNLFPYTFRFHHNHEDTTLNLPICIHDRRSLPCRRTCALKKKKSEKITNKQTKMFSMETYQQQNEYPFINRSKKLFLIIFLVTYVPFTHTP